MKIKKETLDLVLNFPLSEIEDFAYDDFEYLKELVKNHSNFVIYNYSFDNIGITNQSEMKLRNDGKQKIIELLTNLFNIHSQYYYDEVQIPIYFCLIKKNIILKMVNKFQFVRFH